MLDKIEVQGPSGDWLTLVMDDISDGYSLQNIDGLDPVKATLVSSSFATIDGAQYQSARREARNLIFTIGLEADFVEGTVRDLRTTLYGFFMTKFQIKIRFYLTDGLTVDILGVVESFEAPIFVQEPKATISVMCYDPDFYDPQTAEIDGNTTSGSTEMDIWYEGSVESGIVFTLNVNRSLSDITLYHRLPDGTTYSLEFAGSMVADDVLTISTVTGSKSATLLHASTSTSVLYSISPQSKWLEFQHGHNYFLAYAEGAAIPFTIEFLNRYGGL